MYRPQTAIRKKHIKKQQHKSEGAHKADLPLEMTILRQFTNC